MKFQIKHDIRGRIRLHMIQKRMTFAQADTLQYYLETLPQVTSVKVYERTSDAAICYTGDKSVILELVAGFSYDEFKAPAEIIENSGRALDAHYRDEIIWNVFCRCTKKLFIPAPIRHAFTIVRSIKYIKKAIRILSERKLEVPVLDAIAIVVSIIRGDIETAGSIMFLLNIGESLEEWTHKKSVGDLARTMSLGSSNVWLKTPQGEVLVPAEQIVSGDEVIVHMGTVIPFDGVVTSGEAFVNQASMTGEPGAVRKCEGAYAYAGTAVEEGEICIMVKETRGSTKYEKIVSMIEDTEKLKSSSESKAEHLADKLVPYTLGGTLLVYLLSRNITKAVSVLMVDFSCALKMAMPVTVLSAIRESRKYGLTVKGGKFMEAVASADTIVFDKTGTLTKAQPTFNRIIPFGGNDENDLLRIAACLEEHFPHSMAKAVVNEAQKRGLVHDEMHSKVEYIVAHGIASSVDGKRVVIGSYHFVFEDEKCDIPRSDREIFEALPAEYSMLFMAIDGRLNAVICIEDPLRKESCDVISRLKELGIRKIVMMTGDSDRTAKVIAAKAGVDEYYAEVLPEDKAEFVKRERDAGRSVIMVGDGINDSPALSAANVGIAISDGAELAREIADITISGNDLYQLVTLKELSNALMHRINRNYRTIVGFNSTLILLGILGILQPTTSAWLHNGSTIAITVASMKDLKRKR